jgi:hypothetical protein
MEKSWVLRTVFEALAGDAPFTLIKAAQTVVLSPSGVAV